MVRASGTRPWLTMGELLARFMARFIWVPADVEQVTLRSEGAAPPVPRGREFTVLVWNMQYGAGCRHEFFYDGGQAVSVPRVDVEETMGAITEVLESVQPDVVLWQEVDRGSRRTHCMDQYHYLLDRVRYPFHVSTPYHRVGYLPFPAHEHLGRVEMHLAVFSRFRMRCATRFQLPLLAENPVRRLFNLRRALLEVRLEVEGGGELVMFDTHLSAFSRGDGTLARQLAVLDEHAHRVGAEGLAWFLAGDLNALPPGDDPQRLGEAATLYGDSDASMRELFVRHRSVVSADDYASDPEKWWTYVPYGSAKADRTLDYGFVGGPLSVRDVRVLGHCVGISDHLPLLVTLRLD